MSTIKHGNPDFFIISLIKQWAVLQCYRFVLYSTGCVRAKHLEEFMSFFSITNNICSVLPETVFMRDRILYQYNLFQKVMIFQYHSLYNKLILASRTAIKSHVPSMNVSSSFGSNMRRRCLTIDNFKISASHFNLLNTNYSTCSRSSSTASITASRTASPSSGSIRSVPPLAGSPVECLQ